MCGCNHMPAVKEGIGLTATAIEMPTSIFNFSGQARLDTFAVPMATVVVNFDSYDEMQKNSQRLALEAIRRSANEFVFWQHRQKTGRPATDERTLLISFMLLEYFDLSFRQVEGMVGMLADYFVIEHVPDHTTMSRKLSTRRWKDVLERFFLSTVQCDPERKVVAITDASGYSRLKHSWRETSYAKRANPSWIKFNAVVDDATLQFLAMEVFDSNVHESQMFEAVWKKIPVGIRIVRSLADTAFAGLRCLNVVRARGATPIHRIRKDAVYSAKPSNAYQRLVNFAKHWTNRYRKLMARRSRVESVFSMLDRMFNFRLRCRTKQGRRNEVRLRLAMFNIFLLARSAAFWN